MTLQLLEALYYVPNFAGIGPMFGELFDMLGQHGIKPAGPGLTMYYDKEHKEQDIDVAAAVPIANGDLPQQGRVTIRELPAEEMASVVRRGPFDDFSAAYQALLTWIQDNDYQIVGSNREIYLQGPGEGVDPSDYVIKIRFPFKKR